MKRNTLLFTLLLLCLLQTVFAQDAAVPATESRGYLVGPGDVITAKVLGESQFDFVSTVDENGNIEVPFYDKPISVMCHSEREIKSEVTKLLSKYLRAPQIGFMVERKSRPPVIINGEVRQPSQVTLMRKARLLELISSAGGVTESAGGMIQVFRTQAPMCGDPEEVAEWTEQSKNNGGTVSNMYSYSNLKIGTLEANPVIYPGDFVVVQRAAPVYFTGEIRSAQALYIPEGGLSLFQAISMLGGVSKEAKTKDIKIYRLKSNSKDRDTIAVNYDLIKKGAQKDVLLAPYDIVEVDKSKKNLGQQILEMALGIGRTGLTTIGGGLPSKVLY
jgi:polysaccharide export outer membrane protein